MKKQTYEIRICRSREEHFYIEASSQEESSFNNNMSFVKKVA